ncbi:MAG: squalene/phytoene synthase family protein [Rhodospirillales bacterium]
MITDISRNPKTTEVHNFIEDTLAEAAAELHGADRDHYIMAMLAGPADRAGLIALFAFDLELSRIPGKVSEVILGQMRLQSWRDGLIAAEDGRQSGIPLAGALLQLGFPRNGLETLIDARERDLMRTDPPSNMDELVQFAADTGGRLSELAIRHLNRPDAAPDAIAAAARHAGTAHVLTGLARSIPRQWPARRQYVPASFGLENGPEAVRKAAAALAGGAQHEIDRARASASEHGGKPDAKLFPALAAATIAESHLHTLRRCGFDPAHPRTTYRGAGAAVRLAWRRYINRF